MKTLSKNGKYFLSTICWLPNGALQKLGDANTYALF